MKKLDFIDRVDYNKLPIDVKNKRQLFTDLGKKLRKLDRRKDKLKLEIKTIQTETKSVKKEYTKLYKELEFINKSSLFGKEKKPLAFIVGLINIILIKALLNHFSQSDQLLVFLFRITFQISLCIIIHIF